VLLSLVRPAAAQAQPLTYPVCREDAECSRLLEEGKKHAQQGNLAAAAKAYELAYRQRADPLLLFNLARAVHRSGKPGDASPYYEQFLAAGADGKEAMREKAERYLAQARAEAAAATVVAHPPVEELFVSRSPKPPPRKRSDGTRLYRAWWLWTTVGLTTAGLATAIGLAVATQRPDVSGLPTVAPFGL
jgi:hypothetical protein